MRHLIRFVCMLCVSLVLVALPLMAAGTGQEPAPQETLPQAEPPAGVPVTLDGKTLFYVRQRIFTLSAEERANAIAERIRWLSKQPTSRIKEVHTEEAETTTAVVSGDVVIATVTDKDAALTGFSRSELAQGYAEVIRKAAEARRNEYSARSILIGALYAALITALLLLLLKLLGILFGKLQAKLRSWHGVYIRSIRIQKLELLPAERLTGFLQSTARALRLVLSLALLYFYIPLVFSFFPWTHGYSETLFGYILSPVRIVWGTFVAYLPNIFFVAVIVVVAFYVTKLVGFLFAEVGKGTVTLPGFYPEWAGPTYNIVRFLILAFTLIVAFPYLPGAKSPAFQGVSIFLGLLFSLGSTSAIANMVAGSLLTYTRAFQLGDRVRIGDATGDVTEKTLLVTRLRTIKNEDIAIPNAMVLNSHIINYSSSAKEYGLILHTTVTIGYDAPWRKVHELLIGAANATANILKDPKPFVLQTSLDNFHVSYQLNAFTDKPSLMAGIYSELHQTIQDKFNEAGVEIMSPHYSALRDGNQIAIPEDDLPKNYSAPTFRIGLLESLGIKKTGTPGKD